MLRHIAWFNEATIAPDPTGGLVTTDARVRIRCLAPARELEKLGVECSVFGNLHDADPLHVSKHLQKLQTDIVVVGKITGEALLKLARAAKHLGCYVVADFGDETTLSSDLSKLAELADQLVASSRAAAAELFKQTGAEAIVIPDCDGKAGGKHSPDAIAHMWLECFKQLKMKPPACANMNEPSLKGHPS